jgi:putative ABC transport system substrate-binding protein
MKTLCRQSLTRGFEGFWRTLRRRTAPAKIPVETLTRFSLQVRMDVTGALGLPPPLPMFNYAELISAPAK